MKAKYCVEYVYLGERVEAFDGIKQLFRNKKGEFARYSGVRDVYFGNSYLITDDGKIKARFPDRPDKQTVFSTEQEELDYEAHKELAKDYRLRKRKAMELKKPHKDIVRALNLLRPFTRKMDSITLRRFSEYLQNQLSRQK